MNLRQKSIFSIILLVNTVFQSVICVKTCDSQDLDWAVAIGDFATDHGLAITADQSNNVLVTGFFEVSPDFGATTLFSNGDKDIFILKINSFGNALWAKGIGNGQWSNGYGIVTDVSGNVYVVGGFKGLLLLKMKLESAGTELDRGDLVTWDFEILLEKQ